MHVKTKVMLLILAVTLPLAVSSVVAQVPLAAPEAELVSTYVEGPIPLTNPAYILWEDTPGMDVPLSGQTVTTPSRTQLFTPTVTVKSINNGTHIAFLLSWPDPVRNNRTVRDLEFRDAAAVQIAPPGSAPFYCMGSVDVPLNIMQWKADWQTDIEKGFQDLQSAYPNFWVDLYPYAVGEPPYSLPDAFPEVARVYLPGWAVGNPFSQPLKVSPVEDATAKGFGTIATQERQDALGRGYWDGERWSVVIGRRMDTGDAANPRLVTGDRTSVAFAVWDGESGDVGARKSVSNWVAFSIGGKTTPLFSNPQEVAILASGVVGGLAVGFAVALFMVKRKILVGKGSS